MPHKPSMYSIVVMTLKRNWIINPQPLHDEIYHEERI